MAALLVSIKVSPLRIGFSALRIQLSGLICVLGLLSLCFIKLPSLENSQRD